MCVEQAGKQAFIKCIYIMDYLRWFSTMQFDGVNYLATATVLSSWPVQYYCLRNE